MSAFAILERALARAAGVPDTDAQLAERCLALLDAAPAAVVEPIRTLHHFACTGGTLISKCIAALPNVQLLSEVDPLSPYVPAGAENFSPTDFVLLMKRSTRGATPQQIGGAFAAQLRWLHGDATAQGLRLVIRDHAHSQFCHGRTLAPRPSLRELMPEGIPLKSLVTVRHPLDSFASLQKNRWLSFEPASIDHYCRRYLAFLEHHAGVPVMRYEDFVAEPQRLMQKLCGALDLAYEPHFADWFGTFAVSGDSGRSGSTIAARPSSPQAVALEAEAARSDAYRELTTKLSYGLAAGRMA